MNKMDPHLLFLLLLTLCCQLGNSAAQARADTCTVDPSYEYRQNGNTFYRPGVPENLPLDDVLMTLKLLGGDTATLSIPTSSEDDRVKLTDGNILRVNKPLGSITAGVGNIQTIYIDLQCSYDGFTAMLLVIIGVEQVNDNAPIFIGAPYFSNISELALVGTPVYSGIRAEDDDGDTLLYEILPGPYSTHFWFPNVGQGNVALRKPVDYEEVKEVVLQVCAKDSSGGSGGFNTTTTLTVRILDGDDQNPRFEGGPYKASLMEQATVDDVVRVEPQLSAIDPDVNINSPLSYSIINDSEDADYFRINEATGQITLQKDALKRGDKLAFLVKAAQRDNPDRYATSIVRVQIQAANENPPKFVDKEYQVTLVENVPIGTTVARLEAIDNDMELPMTVQLPVSQAQGAVLTFSFEEPNQFIDYFNIHPQKGTVTTVRKLGPLSARAITLGVQVTDGQYNDRAEVRLTIEDINDHSPVFQGGNVQQFDMNTREQGTVITKLVATDDDPDSSITYSLMGNVTEFSISPTGEVVLSVGEEVNLRMTYTLVVQASDNGSPPQYSTKVLHISFGADTGGVVSGSGDSPGYLLIIVIVLGVLSAILLTGIIVLLVMLYRNSSKEGKNKAVRSQSFEKNIDFNSKGYRSYMDTDVPNPAGLAYKTTGSMAGNRHLEIYDAVHLDEDSTQTAQNPFHQGAESYPPRHPYPGHTGVQQKHSNPYSTGTQSTQSNQSVSRQMVEVNEIDYETAVAPMADMMDGDMMYDDSDSLGGSSGGVGAGGGGAGGGAAAYTMGGSTQKLVSSSSGKPRKPGGGMVGGSNLSFVDSPMNSLYSSNNSQIAPNATALGSQDRPGITIYY